MKTNDTAGAKWTRGQIITLVLLVLGYTGYYFCRANFSVAKPSIIDDLVAQGMTKDAAKQALGVIATWGTLSYAFGKFIAGAIGDRLGGRTNMLVGMAGAVLATVLFASGATLPIFTTAWVLNRLLQSLGWPGMMNMASKWFPYTRYGVAVGILSLSYLFGDALARRVYGEIFSRGIAWQTLYFIAAGLVGGVAVISAIFLRDKPKDYVPPTDPLSVYGEDAGDVGKASVIETVLPLVKSPAFWCVCMLSFVLTLCRDTFNEWSPTYFVEQIGMTKDQAASQSAWFPALGGVAVILAGIFGDKLGHVGKGLILFAGLVCSAGLLFFLASQQTGSTFAVWIVAAIGFTLLAPYSYLAGAVALMFGGRRGGATASGIIDGFGYLAGYYSGQKIAEMSTKGWDKAFSFLAFTAVAGAVVAFVFWMMQIKADRKVKVA